MTKFALLPLLLTLAACATPQEVCVNRALAEVRAIEFRIATVSRNIDRGYAVHRSRNPRVGVVACSGGDNFRICQKISDGPRETPVAIDVADERRKLAELQARLADARARAAANVAACRVANPA